MVERWNRQQEMYIGEREARFDALISTVEWQCERAGAMSPTVVDLCCGPAAIGERLLRRLPGSRYIGVDIDPVLLELAREIALSFSADRFEIVEGNVADPAWLERVPAGDVDVVCSSTALHWLSGHELDRALVSAWMSLRPGGVLLNADHLGFGSTPSFTVLSGWVAARDAAAAIAGGASTWGDWWSAARADSRLAPFCVQREQVFPSEEHALEERDEVEAARASADRRPLLSDFIDAARRAGFAEVDTIWQRFDDRIVMAVKSAPARR